MSGIGTPSYSVGVYGSGRVLSRLRDKGLASFWLAMSRGWAESEAFHDSGDWHLLQTKETEIAGLDVDLNEPTRTNRASASSHWCWDRRCP